MLRILAASSIVVGMAACNSGDDAATTDGADATQPTSATSQSDTTEPTGPRDFVVVAASTSWDPVLAGVTASTPPPAAACDTTSPVVNGELELPDFMLQPLGPEPPKTVWFAAFDPSTHTVTVIGRYGDGERVAAGSLDVCTDTWSPINSVLQHPDTGATGFTTALVYDIDSDALVAYTSEGVFVHDAELDQWQHHPAARDDSGRLEYDVLSAAYHPASGMIITAGFGELVAHDVDTDEWTPIASREGDFLGVHAAMDRFVFGAAGGVTWLVDPVSGEKMAIETPELPNVDIGWANEAFGPADGTIFVTDHFAGEICGFDTGSLAWNRCVATSAGAPGWDWAIVGDPVNGRLIGISTTAIETWPLPQP
jgi:hypothetical protein